MRNLVPVLALVALSACVIETEPEYLPDTPAPTTQQPNEPTPAPTPDPGERPERPDPGTSPTPDPTTPPPATPDPQTPPPATPDPTTPPPRPTPPVTPPPVTPPPVTPPPVTTGCVEDAYEPNDDGGPVVTGFLADLTLDEMDVDRFEVDLATGDELVVEAWFANADGNLDLYITDLAGDLLAWSTTDADGELASFVNDGAPMTVFVETNLFDAPIDTCLQYDLDISVHAGTPTPPTPPTPPAPTCADDGHEPNDLYDDAVELLPTIGGTTVYDATAADADWFYVYATPDEELEIIVRHDVPGEQLDVTIWDPAGAVADTTAGSGQEVVATILPAVSGQYVDLLVEPVYADTCAPYTIEVVSTLPVCEDDLYEPNDLTPALVTGPVDLTLYEGDVDRFAVDVYPGEELFVEALFDQVYGDVDLELLDANGYALDWSTSNTSDESLVFFNDGAFVEQLTIEVTLFGADADTCQDVYLDWYVVGAVCYDDGWEGDDTAFGASEILPVAGTSLVLDLVANDDDWFWLETLPGEAVDIWIQHDTPGADLDLTAYDGIGQVAWTYADLAGVSEVLELPVTALGDVYDLEVRPISGPDTCLPYTLTVVSY